MRGQVEAGRAGGNAPASFRVAEGWTIARLTPPSRLYGANGLRTGPDGRIYVAQVSGSQISAIDVDTGEIEAISPIGGEIVAPDDLVFDDAGNLFVTEITEGRVSMRTPNGVTRVLRGDLPVANPITFHQGRLLAGECRPGGRIFELDLHGGAPRILLEDVPMPNAFEVGPDGMLYFPVMAANEIWRVSLAGGAPERVVGDLGVPDSVKFDSKGRIVSTQVASGEVLRIDPRTGARETLARLTPGLDNVTFVGDRIFVSNMSGYVTEILRDGWTSDLVPDGLNWPLGLAADPDGLLYVADGSFSYALEAGRGLRLLGMLFSPGYPGYTRGVAAAGLGEFVVTTGNGQVARFWPAENRSEVIAEGFDQLFGVAVSSQGDVVVAEQGSGRVLHGRGGELAALATGLSQPSGVAVGPGGECFVAEQTAGRIVRLANGRAETVLDGLQKPQGLLVLGERLYVVDADAKSVVEHDLAGGERRVIAAGLPVGAPAGIVPKPIGPIGTFAGPQGPFAGIAAGPNGALYVSGDAEGSVLELRPQPRSSAAAQTNVQDNRGR